MRIVIVLLSLLNAIYMLLDGIYVMIKGKYIGPAKPGPWAELFYNFKIDVFALGPLFIVFGLMWFIWIYSFVIRRPWAFIYGCVICILTLWYLPVGTVI
ncbi:MAG TPA: hypothetical protein VHM26_18745, partial [Chitinophagaceae bacterium]|nr:hypothetical protein [Chitinophagaceae bacterium]